MLKVWQDSLKTVTDNMTKINRVILGGAERITMKWTFSHEKLHSNFDYLQFFISRDSREV